MKNSKKTCLTLTFIIASLLGATNAGAQEHYIICSGTSFSYPGDGSFYNWIVATTPGSGETGASGGSFAAISQTLFNNSTEDIYVMYMTIPPTVSILVTVRPSPTVATATGFKDEICEGNNCTLTFTGTPPFTLNYSISEDGGADVDYQTKFATDENGDFLISNTPPYTATIPVNSPGKFNFKLTKITDGNGCEKTTPNP